MCEPRKFGIKLVDKGQITHNKVDVLRISPLLEESASTRNASFFMVVI